MLDIKCGFGLAKGFKETNFHDKTAILKRALVHKGHDHFSIIYTLI